MVHPPLFLSLQIGAMLVATTATAALPPRQGAVLIWSLRGEAPGRIAAWAVDGDTRLITTGPAGSLIVRGDGARLGRLARAHGAVALRAPTAGCGGTA